MKLIISYQVSLTYTFTLLVTRKEKGIFDNTMVTNYLYIKSMVIPSVTYDLMNLILVTSYQGNILYRRIRDVK